MSPGVITPPVATRRALANPAGAARRAGCTASMVPPSPMYTAPPLTTGDAVIERDDRAGEHQWAHVNTCWRLK